jgi:hypothetical protein
MLPSLFMGAASLQENGFGDFVARIDDGLTVVGIWGSSVNPMHVKVFEIIYMLCMGTGIHHHVIITILVGIDFGL